MIESYKVIMKLVDRYDYGGALEVMDELELSKTTPAILMNSCRYAVNFDFQTAIRLLDQLSDEMKQDKIVKELKKNLKQLNDAEPNALFSELIESIKFKLVNEEYIDFLGRVYRFKEAVFKYMFVKKHLDRKKFSLGMEIAQKRSILKILRKKYRIFNSNLVYGISTYVNRHMKDDYTYKEVLKILNAEKMNQLVELRNDSIVGHGFKGVSIDDIYRAYGNPYNVLDDFRNCLEKLDIKLYRFKYSILNDFIKDEIGKLGSTHYFSKKTKFE